MVPRELFTHCDRVCVMTLHAWFGFAVRYIQLERVRVSIVFFLVCSINVN